MNGGIAFKVISTKARFLQSENYLVTELSYMTKFVWMLLIPVFENAYDPM